jgi:hypothetical protein
VPQTLLAIAIPSDFHRFELVSISAIGRYNRALFLAIRPLLNREQQSA